MRDKALGIVGDLLIRHTDFCVERTKGQGQNGSHFRSYILGRSKSPNVGKEAMLEKSYNKVCLGIQGVNLLVSQVREYMRVVCSGRESELVRNSSVALSIHYTCS